MSTPSIEFFDGIPESLDDVSLRRNRSTGAHIIVMTFRNLRSLDKLNSFTKKSSNSMKLADEEGVISVAPSSVKFFFKGDDGDEFDHLECKFEIEQEAHWERFIRFMNRYAKANGMEYGER
ncbi:MAG: photosystem II reaction center protein Psb28 [Leptolyngbyaceae cyanobacterium]